MGDETGGERVVACARESRALAEARAYRDALAPGGALVCAVGSFDARGGLSYLLSALMRLPEVRAVCVGEGPGREHLERQLEEAQLEHRVGLIVLPSGRERWRALHASDLLVLPALEPLTLGREALAEARRWGRAVVATEVYGRDGSDAAWPERVVIARGDAVGLARAIQQQLATQRRW